MSWFWKGLLLGHVLTGHRGPKQPAGPSVLDPEEKYFCAHCGARIHADDKWCRKCDGILTDEYKTVEVTYAQGQIIGWVVVAGITLVVALILLHYVFGWV